MNIEKLIKSENDLEKQIIRNPEWLEGVTFPRSPRPGHPEGEVINHIVEVLANVDKFYPNTRREDLRLITLIHDSFKHKVNESKERVGENHHATIARRFAERIGITDIKILEIIELHDEGYNAWLSGKNGKWEKAEGRAIKLINRLLNLSNNKTEDVLELYCNFYKCDNATGDKNNETYKWFIEFKNRYIGKQYINE